VRAAANGVGMSPESVYQLRRQPGAEQFRKAWLAALDLGVQRIEDVAMERALNGVEVPVYAYGKIIGTRRVYNDRLLMFVLRNRAPTRFAADGARGLSAVDRHTLARLKKEWHAAWQREAAARDHEDEQTVFQDLDDMIDRMRANEEAAMSPATLALREQFYASQEADLARDNPWQREDEAAGDDTEHGDEAGNAGMLPDWSTFRDRDEDEDAAEREDNAP